jgi:hypothetical protein
MSSILVKARQKAAVVLSSLIETHAADVGRAIEHRLRAHLKEGETMPDVVLVLVLLARLVAGAAVRLVRWDRVKRDEDDDAGKARLRRDLAALGLRQKLLEARDLAAALYGGRRGSEVLGLTGRVPQVRQPEALLTRARALIDRLRDPNLQAPAGMLGIAFDPGQLARELETGVTALGQALDEVEREQRQAGTTVAAKGDAMGELDSVMKACALVMKGAFALAGRPDLARKLGELSRRKKPVPTGKEVDVKTR